MVIYSTNRTLYATPDTALIQRMREFSFALGVRCQHCHAGGNGVSLEGVSFKSDDRLIILTKEEAAKKPWPRTLQEAQTWSFSDDAQAWTKP